MCVFIYKVKHQYRKRGVAREGRDEATEYLYNIYIYNICIMYIIYIYTHNINHPMNICLPASVHTDFNSAPVVLGHSLAINS